MVSRARNSPASMLVRARKISSSVMLLASKPASSLVSASQKAGSLSASSTALTMSTPLRSRLYTPTLTPSTRRRSYLNLRYRREVSSPPSTWASMSSPAILDERKSGAGKARPRWTLFHTPGSTVICGPVAGCMAALAAGAATAKDRGGAMRLVLARPPSRRSASASTSSGFTLPTTHSSMFCGWYSGAM